MLFRYCCPLKSLNVLWIIAKQTNKPAPSIPHFKGFGMRNLQYEIRICQKSHNTVTITVYVWTVVRILMKQTLCQVFLGIAITALF